MRQNAAAAAAIGSHITPVCRAAQMQGLSQKVISGLAVLVTRSGFTGLNGVAWRGVARGLIHLPETSGS